MVSCSDSGVGPELLFDRGPGDLFAVCVAGNFVTQDGLGSLKCGAAVGGAGEGGGSGVGRCGLGPGMPVPAPSTLQTARRLRGYKG